MPSYVEYRFWSPVLGCNASRVSVFDKMSQEYYRIIPRETEGKAYREMKADVVNDLLDAIARGDEPGEVASDD